VDDVCFSGSNEKGVTAEMWPLSRSLTPTLTRLEAPTSDTSEYTD
jgi:hypothetical protein